MLTGALGALVKQLKIWKEKTKSTLKTTLFQISKSKMHKFQENIFFYNSLTSAQEVLVNISH